MVPNDAARHQRTQRDVTISARPGLPKRHEHRNVRRTKADDPTVPGMNQNTAGSSASPGRLQRGRDIARITVLAESRRAANRPCLHADAPGATPRRLPPERTRHPRG